MSESRNIAAIKSAVIIIQCIAFIGLACFAIFDVYTIIKDYIEDNRFTSVKPINITGQFPFTGHYSTLCINYGRSVFPPEKLTKPEKFEAMLLEYWTHGWNLSWKDETKRWNDDQYQKLGRAVFDSVTVTLIQKTFENFKNQTIFTENSKLSYFAEKIGHSTLLKSLDTFLENPDRIKITKNAWSTTQNYLIQFRAQKDVGEKPWLTIPQWQIGFTAAIDASVFCFEIPLLTWLHKQNSKLLHIDMDFVHQHSSDDQYQLPMTKGNFSLPGKNVEMEQGPVNISTGAFIQIYNTAVFDNQLFPPCTMDFDTENACLQDIKIRTISDSCRCLLIGDQIKRLVQKSGSVPDGHLCTLSKFNGCASTAYSEAEKRMSLAKSKGICRPCIIPKNTYAVDIANKEGITVPQTELENGKTYDVRKNIDVACEEVTYILFQDKQQYTWSQMVSQVGGDLGLYIGFSMISFLQMFLFFYQIFHHGQNPKDTRENFWKRFCKAFVQYFSDDHSMNPESATDEFQKSIEKQLQEHENALISHYKAMESRLLLQFKNTLEQLKVSQMMEIQCDYLNSRMQIDDKTEKSEKQGQQVVRKLKRTRLQQNPKL